MSEDGNRYVRKVDRHWEWELRHEVEGDVILQGVRLTRRGAIRAASKARDRLREERYSKSKTVVPPDTEWKLIEDYNCDYIEPWQY